jgi:hypothetical protein|nr:MAG: hypothetical protein [Bacteriophage sp.]
MHPLPCDGEEQRERTAVFLSVMPKSSKSHGNNYIKQNKVQHHTAMAG